MSEVSNYGDLKKLIQTWLNRKDASTIKAIPTFIAMAEKQFTRMVRLPYYENTMNRIISGENPYIEIPRDFLSVKHLAVNGKVLTRVNTEVFTRIETKDEKESGGYSKPYYFTRVGSKMFTHPPLKDGDKYSLTYNRDIPEMKDDKDSPYTLAIAPDLMLYLSLRHAATYLRDNEMEMFWAQKAAEAASDINRQLDEAEWSGSTLVVQMFDNGE